jgi:hypothetical protein
MKSVTEVRTHRKETKMPQSICIFVTVDVYTSRVDFVLGVSVQPWNSDYDPNVPKIKNFFFCSQCSVLESLESLTFSLYSSCEHGRKAKVGVIENSYSFIYR